MASLLMAVVPDPLPLAYRAVPVYGGWILDKETTEAAPDAEAKSTVWMPA